MHQVLFQGFYLDYVVKYLKLKKYYYYIHILLIEKCKYKEMN